MRTFRVKMYAAARACFSVHSGIHFYFRDKVTLSDHTPYNFPHGNGDPQRVFQRQNDSKTLARLSKRVGRCRGRTAMPKGGS